MTRATAFVLIVCVLERPAPASDVTGQRVHLRHGLQAGTLARYELTARSTRLRRGPAEHTQLEQSQSGRLVQYVLEADAGRARRVQMLALGPSEVRRHARDGFAVVPPPTAASLGLDPGGAYMTIDEATPTAAPPLVPAEQATALALLSALFAWPIDDVVVGQHWSRPTESGGLAGSLIWSLARVDLAPDCRTATISARFGPPSGGSAGPVRLDSATAELVWDLDAGSVLNLTARVVCLVRHPDFDDEYETDLTAVRREVTVLGEGQRQQMREALRELAEAVAAEKRGSPEAALAKARRFLTRWPDAAWRPVAEQLIERLAPPPAEHARAAPFADEGELQRQLAAAVERWQKATREHDERALSGLREWFEQVVAANRDAVVSLLPAADPGARAVGVFALAFSEHDLDLVAMQEAAGDADGRVRAWAAYGLAIRGDAQTDFGTLRLLVGDEDTNVRARACEAVAACVPADSRDARRACRLLLARLADDEDAVRYQAASALTHLATRADLPRIEAVRKRETTAAVREILDRLLQILTESKPR